jgi:hypothetical protein
MLRLSLIMENFQAMVLHTFITLKWRRAARGSQIPLLIVALCWLYMLLFVTIALQVHQDKANPFNTPTPYWCWISSNFLIERIFGLYLWLWLELGASVILYPLLFYCLRKEYINLGYQDFRSTREMML